MNEIAFDTETTSLNPLEARLQGISFYKDGTAKFLNCEQGVPQAEIRCLLESRDTLLIGHNIKYDLHVLRNHGIILDGPYCDTMIAAHLLGKDGIGLKERAKDVGMHLRQYKEVNTSKAEELAEYAKNDAEATYRLKQQYIPMLIKNNLYGLFIKIEMPMVEVLLEMERTGIKINRSYLEKLQSELPQKIKLIEDQFYLLVKKPINMNSPKQLTKLFFNDLKLKPIKRSKKTRAPSVDVEVLEYLASKDVSHAKLILEHRLMSKLLNTYITPILEGLDSRGRIHTSLNQTVTATGRLSSSEPNLQNIPIRSGATIRQAFVAEKGMKLICVDYSQIELRVLAHFSQDKVMVGAFRDGRDLHAETASLIFKVPVDKVSKEMRNVAKTLNFGIIYGMGSRSLSKQLKISQEEAKDFIDRYFLIYRETKNFKVNLINDCRRKGYVTTLFGRRRMFPDIDSYDEATRSVAERMAVNTPIQGTAAEIIKLSMIMLHNEFKNTDTKMLIQIHDELLFETPENKAIEASKIIKETMETAIKLHVPLEADIKICNTWADK